MYTRRKRELMNRLENLNRKFSEKEYRILYRFSYDISPELRSDTARLLCDHYTPKAEKILLRMTYDVNEMVRLEAADSLCIGRTEKSLNRLYRLLYSKDCLLRAYAALSLLDVVRNRKSEKERKRCHRVIKKFIRHEEDSMVKIMALSGLYQKGERKVFPLLLDTMHKDIAANGEKHFWLAMNVFDAAADKSNLESIRKEVENIRESLRHKECFSVFEKRIDESLCRLEHIGNTQGE